MSTVFILPFNLHTRSVSHARCCCFWFCSVLFCSVLFCQVSSEHNLKCECPIQPPPHFSPSIILNQNYTHTLFCSSKAKLLFFFSSSLCHLLQVYNLLSSLPLFSSAFKSQPANLSHSTSNFNFNFNFKLPLHCWLLSTGDFFFSSLEQSSQEFCMIILFSRHLQQHFCYHFCCVLLLLLSLFFCCLIKNSISIVNPYIKFTRFSSSSSPLPPASVLVVCVLSIIYQLSPNLPLKYYYFPSINIYNLITKTSCCLLAGFCRPINQPTSKLTDRSMMSPFKGTRRRRRRRSKRVEFKIEHHSKRPTQMNKRRTIKGKCSLFCNKLL